MNTVAPYSAPVQYLPAMSRNRQSPPTLTTIYEQSRPFASEPADVSDRSISARPTGGEAERGAVAKPALRGISKRNRETGKSALISGN
jgi:hypothetical protein